MDCQWSSLHKDALIKVADALEGPDRWAFAGLRACGMAEGLGA